MLTVLLIGLLQAASAPAAAPPVDCARFARLLGEMARGNQLSSADAAWAIQIEQSKRCDNAVSWTAVNQPAPPEARTLPASSPAAQYTGPVGQRLSTKLPAAANCPDPIIDEASERPCDWLALHYAYSTGQGRPKDTKQALFWLQRSADARQPMAEYLLGQAYETGRLGMVDPDQSTRWMMRAAQQGHVRALSSVGSNYFLGYGVPVDKAQAAIWHRRAADRGDGHSMAMLGLMLEDGDGIPANGAAAIALYRAGVERGDPHAQWFLGRAHLGGRIAPFDPPLARTWLVKAAAAGLEGAARDLANMDRVNREFAAGRGGGTQASTQSSGPSLADQVLATLKRQNRENCEAASRGANRVCNIR